MTVGIPTKEELPQRIRFGDVAVPLGVSSMILVALLLPKTQPVCWYWCASFLAWAVLRRRASLWAKAGAAILGPVSWGLLAVVIVLMIFGSATTAAELAEVKSIERVMLWLNEHRVPDLKDWPFTTLAVLLLLTYLSYLQPRWKIVQRTLWLKNGLTQIFAAFAVAASFTFFSQTYVAAPYAESAYLRLAAALRHSREAEVQHGLSRVCMEELTKSIKALPAPARTSYQQILQTLAAWDRARATEMLSDFVRFHERSGAPHELAPRHPETDRAPEDRALPSPGEIADALAAQKTREVAQEKKRRAAEQEMSATMGEVLGIGNEHWAELIGELAEKFLEPYIGEHSKILLTAVSEYLSGVTEESLDRYLEKWRERQAEQLTKRVQEMVEGKPDAVAALAKPEMEKLTALTKQVAMLAYPEAAETANPDAPSSGGISEPETLSASGHIRASVRPPQNRPRQKTGPELIKELKEVRDRLELLATHDGWGGANGPITGDATNADARASADQVINEVRQRIAEADVSIDSGRKIMLEYEKAIQFRSVAREAQKIPEVRPIEAPHPRLLPMHR